MGHTGIAITPGYDSRYGDTAFGKSCVRYGAHDVRVLPVLSHYSKEGHLFKLKSRHLVDRLLQLFIVLTLWPATTKNTF